MAAARPPVALPTSLAQTRHRLEPLNLPPLKRAIQWWAPATFSRSSDTHEADQLANAASAGSELVQPDGSLRVLEPLAGMATPSAAAAVSMARARRRGAA